MKQFRIYLKTGNSFTVQAHGFKNSSVNSTPFVDENDKPNKAIYLNMNEVAAVIETSALIEDKKGRSAAW
jgi:hypothetical protein